LICIRLFKNLDLCLFVRSQIDIYPQIRSPLQFSSLHFLSVPSPLL